MALTSAQLVAVREYIGYAVTGDSMVAGYRELVFSNVSYLGLSIETRLANLSSDEENRLTTFYLPNLAAREQEIQEAACNLDTDTAAVWKHNRDEVEDRKALFNDLRLRLCKFLGFAPGEDLISSNSLIRA